MKSPFVYLDEAATAYLPLQEREEIADMAYFYIADQWENPSSAYYPAEMIRKNMEQTRAEIAAFINAEPNEIYFTSGGSESNSWALQGFVRQVRCNFEVYRVPVIYTSTIEHNSIIKCAEGLRKLDACNLTMIPVDKKGVVSPEKLNDIMCNFKPHQNIEPLVSIQFANNEIGTIQNIRQLSSVAHQNGAVFHTDAVQAFGHIPIDVKTQDVDLMSVSGHKIGAPKGIGFLYIRNGIQISPLIYGAQEQGLRGGTENVSGIMALHKAIQIANYRASHYAHLPYSTSYFLSQLLKLGCRANGDPKNHLPNNISVILPDGIHAQSLLVLLESSNIFASVGSACNSNSIQPSHVLKAIGLTDEQCASTIRFTLPDSISIEDIDYVVSEIKKAIQVLNVLPEKA